MWRVKTDSNRHQSGGPVVGVITPDYEYDLWYWCNIRKQPSPNLRGESCESAMASNTYGSARTHEEVLRMIEDTPDKIARKLAEYDENNRAITDRWTGAYGWLLRHHARRQKCADRPDQPNRQADESGRTEAKAESGTLLHRTSRPHHRSRRAAATDVVRNGFNLNNRFRLSDKLSLTLAADYQRETLEERTDTADSNDLMNTFGVLTEWRPWAAAVGEKARMGREPGLRLETDFPPEHTGGRALSELQRTQYRTGAAACRTQPLVSATAVGFGQLCYRPANAVLRIGG